MKLPLGPGELDASLGEFRVRKLYEMTILPFLVALSLDLTNNHQNPKRPLGLALVSNTTIRLEMIKIPYPNDKSIISR